MTVHSFEFDEYIWKLDTIYLDKLNLIVGKNAVGKSKTLNSIVQVARFIKGDISGILDHSCRIVFKDDDDKELIYSYKGNSNEIISESMIYDNRIIISRDPEKVKINGEPVNPPANKLVIQSQRDTNKYPEFELVMSWAEHTRGFSFSNLSSSKPYIVPSMFSENIDFSELYMKLDEDKKRFVKGKMCELGYNVTEIAPLQFDKFNLVTLHEEGVSVPLFSSSLSNGMLRVFYIFTYMAYIAGSDGAKTFLVDDMGEGLDYSRSAKLSKMMFDYCEEHGIQLIVTSNDNFLMNAIDLNYWIILQRTRGYVSAICNKTHPEMFRKFRRMGLNNFDMLSTGFIDRFLSKPE